MNRTLSFRRRLLLPAFLLVLGAAPVVLPGCKTDYAKETEKHTAEQKVKDDAAIREYLTANNITNFTRTESGLYIVPVTEGTSEQLTVGKTAQVKYIGSYLNKTKFESSVDNGSPCGCISVIIGVDKVLIGNGSAVEGWNQTIPKMKVGDRKILLIPSYLGYGTCTTCGVPADTPLVFDVEVLSQR
ncbi:hypothetical protein FY528_09675 [Hymenobacter lutimineralis]|uniref:Peptidyl-prolyl cis-trans isomerase n=1 Tax=Hymenobacter lutimineralis TaxID=2606448 RepID=A0A5D6V4U3_9BACT|nr:FKBP-type peptidyl-prolyl cis-trans isomerase [Hymenobacter lutimineralis]TYZ10122.1 hypothetical protein FY528_09675 [Hymenobacter lutimineralis]